MMNLELETKTTVENGETHVEALLRNAGTAPATILLEPQLHHPFARLLDEQGKELKGRDDRAMEGRRSFEPPLRTKVLRPGDAVRIEGFQLNPSTGIAMAGPQSWDLKEVHSRSLILEMGYEVTAEAAQETKLLEGPDVAVGRWTSKPVTLSYRK
jgi:hypothetical protein